MSEQSADPAFFAGQIENMDRVRVAVKMQPLVDADGRAAFKATLPMGVLFEKTLDPARLEMERAALEQRYAALIEELKQLRTAMKSGEVLRYWEFGDAVARFVIEIQQSIVFVEKLNQHLARDLGMSAARVWVCETLRKRFPDPTALDPRQSITAYQRANFDPARLPRTRQPRTRGRLKRR